MAAKGSKNVEQTLKLSKTYMSNAGPMTMKKKTNKSGFITAKGGTMAPLC
jgi:hypothetical protein